MKILNKKSFSTLFSLRFIFYLNISNHPGCFKLSNHKIFIYYFNLNYWKRINIFFPVGEESNSIQFIHERGIWDFIKMIIKNIFIIA